MVSDKAIAHLLFVSEESSFPEKVYDSTLVTNGLNTVDATPKHFVTSGSWAPLDRKNVYF